MNCKISELKIPGGQEEFIKLITAVMNGSITNLVGKSVLKDSIASGTTASDIIKQKNLIQISDTEELDNIAAEVIKENPKPAADFRGGKESSIMFLVGQAMRKSKGKANPKIIQEIIKRRLSNA
jgi:aspartyl-tRNA(Asn)/glutamyl-tRNA(Gln) amidotransferase subunit B